MATQTAINKRLTLVINAPLREKEHKKSRWTIQYEFKLWRFGAYQEVHTFVVGPEAVPFTLHTNLLRERCPTFLDELLQREGQVQPSPAGKRETCLLGDISPCPTDRPLDLRTLRVTLFRVFATWLYTGQLVLPEEYASKPPQATRLVAKAPHKVIEAAGTWRDEDLIDLYLFASRHELWELANLAITRLWKQNDQYCRTTALPAIERAFAAGAFGWDDSLGCSGPNQKPYVMRLQDYLLFEGARRLEDIKASWLDLMLTTHLFPPPYNRALHARYHESPRAIEKRHHDMPEPFWEYEPCYFHCHEEKEEQKKCAARGALSLPDSPNVVPRPSPVVSPTFHTLLRGVCTVLVGRGQVSFTLHKELACHVSDFFRDTFGDAWHGPPNDTIQLPHEQPRDFALFASWLYSAEICLPTLQEVRGTDGLPARPKTPKGKDRVRSDEDGSQTNHDSGVDVSFESDACEAAKLRSIREMADDDSADDDETTAARCAREPDAERETNEARFLVRKHQQDLIRLYAFAIRMKIPALRNAVMDKFVEHRESGTPYASSSPEILRLAYKLNPPNSLICSYLIQEAAFTFRGLPRDKSGYAQLLPPQFLHDLLEYQFTRGIFPKLREHVPSWRVDLCELHTHTTEDDASTCKARNAEWQQALREKGSTWEPIRKEFGQRQSYAAAQPNVAGRRLERTPTPRGSSSRESPARRPVATPPTTDTLSNVSPIFAPTRPPAGAPPAIPRPVSIMSQASSNMSSISLLEIQRTPQAKRPESFRKDSAVTSMEIKITPPRPDSISSADDADEEEDTDITPPHTPIKDAHYRTAPPIPHKASYNELHDLQRALPPSFGPRSRASTFHANPKIDLRRSGIDVLAYRAPDPPPPPPAPSRVSQPPPQAPTRASQPAPSTQQARAVHFSRHRITTTVNRLRNRPFTHPKSPVSSSSGEKEHGPGEESEAAKTLRTMIDSLNPL
ncbi:hypothetical protein CKM354_001297200 [Cercospora kikuchii]|uniref:BTB domain-containing protein n=1 Tax=Cercospora kikuchii TaxID=84275 RepID=A0A9P3FN16_9PEZI|nr:uncharacterized protein CKM354_001297200 [Cercospora kikuchii]GIZ49956.1 hypothetical protein CKM354_001297200 [Cercospora kikuchii]